MNILEQQAHNKRLTWIVVLVFILFFVFLGLGMDYFYFGFAQEKGAPIPIATPFALLFAGGSVAFSFAAGVGTVISSTGARPANPADPKEKQFMNVVEEMAISAGLKPPAAYIVPDNDPNAFATGMSPESSSIAVTQGLLNSLNREELQGVVAHEMSHIRNYDIRLMLIVACLVGSVVLISDWASRMMWYGGSRRSSGSKKDAGGAQIFFFAIWIISVILAPLIAQIMAMCVSRKREYLADASGAELTRNPNALASALKKIEFAAEPTKSMNRGTAHLCIADPIGRSLGNKEGFAADLFSTHPPMVKRISALKEMAYMQSR